ncbi:MAG TPA: hypothetical protein VH761_07280 [Ilumatobacteraceae bacterium]
MAQQLLLMSRYDVGGHAAEHLGGASAPFMAAAVVALLLWTTPQVRLDAGVFAALAAWFGACVAVMLGNLRVVDDLIAAGYAHTPTSSIPDVADHSLANSSIWYAVVAALAVVAMFRWRRQIGNRATIGAVVATVIVPPWIIPGAGVIVLAIIRCVARVSSEGRSVPAPGQHRVGRGRR